VAFVLAATASFGAAPAQGAEHYALIVSGAAGGPAYAERYRAWRTSFESTLREQFGYPEDHVMVLADEEGAGARQPTRENVRAALDDLARRAAADDVVLVLLMGHGTAEGEEAKFNLVGPDLAASEWAALVKAIAGRLVFVNSTGGSSPFLRHLAGPGRIVITATDTPAQQFETVFPEFFIGAFEDEGADADKNGRVSVSEAFDYATLGVREWFEARGELATERPRMDDAGHGDTRALPGRGGQALAHVTYLQPAPAVPADNPAVAALLRQRRDVEARIEQHRAARDTMPAGSYEAELEKLLLELARIDRELRAKPGSR
jgi:hypothetical protein